MCAPDLLIYKEGEVTTFTLNDFEIDTFFMIFIV